jgi:hypothetical protein
MTYKVIAKSAIEIVAEFGPFDTMAEAKLEAQDLADMMESRDDLNVYVLDPSAQAEMGLEGPVAAHEAQELEHYGPMPQQPDHHYDSDGFRVDDVEYDEILDNPSQWLQEADQEIEGDGTEGAFTKQARRAGYTNTMEFARKVMAGWRSGKKTVYNKKTRKKQGITKKTMFRANFAINAQKRRRNPGLQAGEKAVGMASREMDQAVYDLQRTPYRHRSGEISDDLFSLHADILDEPGVQLTGQPTWISRRNPKGFSPYFLIGETVSGTPVYTERLTVADIKRRSPKSRGSLHAREMSDVHRAAANQSVGPLSFYHFKMGSAFASLAGVYQDQEAEAAYKKRFGVPRASKYPRAAEAADYHKKTLSEELASSRAALDEHRDTHGDAQIYAAHYTGTVTPEQVRKAGKRWRNNPDVHDAERLVELEKVWGSFVPFPGLQFRDNATSAEVIEVLGPTVIYKYTVGPDAWGDTVKHYQADPNRWKANAKPLPDWVSQRRRNPQSQG